MKKIPSAFKRRYDGDRQIYDERVEGTEWISGPEAVATEKFDGTACLIQDGKLLKRYSGKIRGEVPEDFVEIERDEATGKVFGWVPVGDGPEDQYHREGWTHEVHRLYMTTPPDGTYELVGPKVQSNPYGLDAHELWRHGSTKLYGVPTDFEGLRSYLTQHCLFEGVVWHRRNGDMVKNKRKDFGLPWPPKKGE